MVVTRVAVYVLGSFASWQSTNARDARMQVGKRVTVVHQEFLALGDVSLAARGTRYRARPHLAA